ncbi:beta strand repeat-containing protein [Pseudochelatococcus sp. G4_1912]|uniref:beta strand repeat-containing protein n=1 Tax=Pseudochelatococcus sp. G4_1912 TaxID=3114288 RepID=UPI0039C5BCF5
MSSAVACAQGLPSGAQIVNGQADVTQNGSSLAVRQASPTAIISWDQFSIGQPNSVHFDNGVGSTLNRVRGNIASQIDGSLTATGSVYLINPAGIAVGPTGRIETGGSFIGSTLDISDDDFQKAARGEAHTFKGTSGAAVRNAGRIGALGGSVVLMGRTVENEGDIEAPNGTAALVAGTEVLVQDRSLDGGRFVVKAGGATTSVKNTGNIKAAEVELRANGGNVYALAGNRHGVIAATGTSKQGGRVFLTAGDTGAVTVTQRVSATKAASSSNRGRKGGEIRIAAQTVQIAASLDAHGVLPPARPDDLKGDGGTVIVAGDNITLTDAARVDVSGAKGGIALIGGDYQGGANTAANYVSEKVSTAKLLTVAKGAVITADASEGNGGKIVLWSDLHTDFAGHVSATSVTGLGGDAEVSGKATLAFNGTANLLGQAGAGTLLLDPYNLTIVAGSGGSVTPVADNSTLGVDTLTGLLASANTVVTTGSGGAQLGNIIVNAAITWNAATTLTLNAANTIAINAAITAVNGGLTLKAASGTEAAPTITTGAGGTINVGTFFLETGAWVQNSATLPAFSARDFRIAGGESVSYDDAAAPTVTFIRVTGGTGADDANAYAITDVYGLQGMATIRNRYYKLAANIDAGSTVYWYGGAGFSPIGNNTSEFTGSFNGQGYTVSGLTINRPLQSYIGLFGKRGGGGGIKNVGLEGGSIIGGYSYVGGLVGYSSGNIVNTYATLDVSGGTNVGGLIGYAIGSIDNSYATGDVNGSGGNIGGLVGQSDTGIIRSFATGNVSGQLKVGGLIGYNKTGNVYYSYATGNVTGQGMGAGGLIGQSNLSGTAVAYSYATGNVQGSYAGGLIGESNSSTIRYSYATGSVDGFAAAGGLVGRISAAIEYSYATGAVSGPSGSTGGLTGIRNSGTMTSSFWDVDTTGQTVSIGDGATSGATGIYSSTGSKNAFTQATYAGFNFTSIWYIVPGETRPFLRAELTELGKTYNKPGSLVANAFTIRTPNQLQLIKMHEGATSSGKTYILANDIDLTGALANNSSMWRTTTTKSAANLYGFSPIGTSANTFQGTFVGPGHVINGLTINRPGLTSVGLFGETAIGSTIKNVELRNVNITGASDAGGLAGKNRGAVSGIIVSGAIKGTVSVGGITGGNTVEGSLSTSYSAASISGAGDGVGGLVGWNSGSISNSYSTGNVNNTGAKTGGLAGILTGTITNSYATGVVTGASLVGGLVGENSAGTITSSFWNLDAVATGIGSGSSAGATGLTLAQFKNTTYFMNAATGWDFENIWAPPGDGYLPELYALSKVIRIQANNGATTAYGNSSGTWIGGTPGSTIYGQGAHISGDTAYGTASSFGATPSINVTGLNVGSYIAEVTGLNSQVVREQEYLSLYLHVKPDCHESNADGYSERCQQSL